MCTHYWKIDPPMGPISNGICKICGAEKIFPNWVDTHLFKSSTIVAPIDDNPMELVQKLIDGTIESYHGTKRT